MRHPIRIEPAGSAFVVRGAVQIASSRKPLIDAARALRDAGAPDTDILVVAGSVVSISAVAIGAVLKPRRLPVAAYPSAHAGSY